MNGKFPALLSLLSFFVVVRSGAIAESPGDSRVLSSSESDQQVWDISASDADRQVWSTDSDQQVWITNASDEDRQVSSTDSDQKVPGNVNASDADRQVSTYQTSEERNRERRIRMLKIQILKNVKDPPQSKPSGPPSQFSRELIQLMLQQDAAEEQSAVHRPPDGGERLAIHATGKARECSETKGGKLCKMIRFDVKPSFNKSSVQLWIYKLGGFPKRILVSVSLTSSTDEFKFLGTFDFERKKAEWNKLPLPPLLLPSSWNETFSYQVEINGENIEHQGDHRPFLMVSRSHAVASRRRRDIDCDTNESCCVKPLRVSFAEIGFNWVLYPEHLDANFCTGTCRMDHGELRTHYERAMTQVIDNDYPLQEVLGQCWTLCCKPKQLAAVRVIYNDTDGVYHDQYIPELVVKSCSCS